MEGGAYLPLLAVEVRIRPESRRAMPVVAAGESRSSRRSTPRVPAVRGSASERVAAVATGMRERPAANSRYAAAAN